MYSAQTLCMAWPCTALLSEPLTVYMCACVLPLLQNLPPALAECRYDIAATLRAHVLGPLLSYLPTISPFLQDCPTTRRLMLQEDTPYNWQDVHWQMVREQEEKQGAGCCTSRARRMFELCLLTC